MEQEVNPLKRKVHALFEDLSLEIKKYEDSEDYELCQEILSYTKQLSDYLLGYSDYTEIEELLYWICKSKGTIFSLEESKGLVVFDCVGQPWGFTVDYEEMMHLINIQEEQIKIKNGQ